QSFSKCLHIPKRRLEQPHRVRDRHVVHWNLTWRWVFSSSLLPGWSRFVSPDGAGHTVSKALCGLLNVVFPDECRICGESLQHFSRLPICNRCLGDPAPLVAEFYCIACRTPFVNRFPLDETGRCMICRLGLQGFDSVYSYGSYEGTLRKLVHLFKYG